MVTVCAWCRRFLGVKQPREEVVISHGMCEACMNRHRWKEAPTLVVSRCHEGLVPVLRDLLQGTPEIRMVVDRRGSERRGEPVQDPNRERREGDRRRGATIALV